MIAAALPIQLRNDAVHSAPSRFAPFKIDLVFAEVITVLLVSL